MEKKDNALANEVTAGNKLIAEFMGGKHFPNGIYSEWRFPDGTRPEVLRYHECWDWLMDVVEKIEGLGYHSCIDYFGEHRVFFSHDSIGVRDDSKIMAVYHAVVQFIIWHNIQATGLSA